MANESQDGTATEFCSNCKRNIPSVNYLMHQNHCSRNIVLCGHCQEPVPRSEMEEHNEEYHVKVTCKCGQAVEKWKQDEHDADHCPQRQATCQFCEMGMDIKDLAEHTDFCGSRTDPCPLCKRYIFFRDKSRHEASSCRFPETKPTKPSSVTSSAQRDQWQQNQLLNITAAPKTFPLGAQEQFALPLVPKAREGMGEGWRGLGVAAISDGVTDDRKHRKNQDRVQNVMTKLPSRGREKNEERALLQSTVNQEELDHRLAQHLAEDLSYKPSLDADLSPDEAHPSYGPSSFTNFQDDFAIQKILKETYSIPAMNTFEEQILGDVTLPCEFCQQLIPAENLIQHQSGCRPDLACQPLAEPRANNSRERSHQHPQQPAEVLNNLTYESSYGLPLPGYTAVDRTESPVTYDDDNMLMLPCEFCEALLPVDALPMHQVNCIENRTVTPAPATFDTGPGAYPARRGGAVESPIRPMPHRVQRPQDFAVPNRPKKYQEESGYVALDPSLGDDDDVGTIPVRMAQSRHLPPMKPSQPPHSVIGASFPSGASQEPPVPRSASEKYLHGTKRAPQPKPTATVASLPTGGAVQKPRSKNTARPEYREERPQSKSSARVKEKLQRLCDAPNVSSEQELNTMKQSTLPTRPDSQDGSYMYKQMNNGSHYKSTKKAVPPPSFNPSSLEFDDRPLPAAQLNPSSGPDKAARQSTAGARQKVRKPHGNSRGVAQHSDGYSPSFPSGAHPRKGGDAERRGNSSGTRKPKQLSAPNTGTLDSGVQTKSLQLKESTTQRKANYKPAQGRQAAPKYHDDPLL